MNAAVQVKADAGTTELERAPVPLAVVETQAAPSPAPKKKRRGGRFFLMALLPALLVVGGGYFWITGERGIDVEQLRAAYSQAIAQERVAAGELDYSTSQYERSKELAGRGISAKSALDEA